MLEEVEGHPRGTTGFGGDSGVGSVCIPTLARDRFLSQITTYVLYVRLVPGDQCVTPRIARYVCPLTHHLLSDYLKAMYTHAGCGSG